MANILEVETWDDGVYQLETTDPVQGGADGVDNTPHKNLANRTLWLKNNKADKNGNAENKFKVAAATANDEAIQKEQFDSALSLISSAGTVVAFANSSVPNGFLECNGAELSRSVYASLYAAIGTTYGTGDGSTTFNIPDLRGEFIRGFDNGRGVDSSRVIGTSQGDAIRNITGSFSPHFYQNYAQILSTGVFAAGTANTLNQSLSGGSSSGTAGVTFDASRVVPTANENRPRNIAMMYCIKY